MGEARSSSYKFDFVKLVNMQHPYWATNALFWQEHGACLNLHNVSASASSEQLGKCCPAHVTAFRCKEKLVSCDALAAGTLSETLSAAQCSIHVDVAGVGTVDSACPVGCSDQPSPRLLVAGNDPEGWIVVPAK